MAAPAGKGRKRLQITISEELDREITQICEKAHMSRGAWVEYTLAMAIHGYDEMLKAVSGSLQHQVVDAVEISGE